MYCLTNVPQQWSQWLWAGSSKLQIKTNFFVYKLSQVFGNSNENLVHMNAKPSRDSIMPFCAAWVSHWEWIIACEKCGTQQRNESVSSTGWTTGSKAARRAMWCWAKSAVGHRTLARMWYRETDAVESEFSDVEYKSETFPHLFQDHNNRKD